MVPSVAHRRAWASGPRKAGILRRAIMIASFREARRGACCQQGRHPPVPAAAPETGADHPHADRAAAGGAAGADRAAGRGPGPERGDRPAAGLPCRPRPGHPPPPPPPGEARRARIVLLAAARARNAAIARQLGCHADTVRATRRRYLAEGVRAMKDRPRPGRALVYDIDARLLVIATATSEPAGPGTAGTHAGIAAHLAAEHQIPVSASQAGRILAEADIKLHLVRGWLNRKDDPAFFGKARAICDLYRNPPPGAVLLSIDEKTGVQARSPQAPHPASPARPPRAARVRVRPARHRIPDGRDERGHRPGPRRDHHPQRPGRL